MSFSNLSVSYFMVYWFHKVHKVMKFSLETENRKKICRYIHGLLKNRYKVLLWCSKSAKCDADVEVSPCSLKNTSFIFPIITINYIW